MISAMHLLVVVAALFADLAPDVYKHMQAASPEALVVRVITVDVRRSFDQPPSCAWYQLELVRQVRAEAVVERVIRSKSGVHAGDMIKIEYPAKRPCSGYDGPRPIPLVEEEEHVTAYLRKNRDSFIPAARGASFVR